MTRGLCATLLAPLLAAGLVRAEPVLTAQAVGGEVQRDRLGERTSLAPGDSLLERDVVRLGPTARLVLSLPGDSRIELGPDTVLAIEKLPASAATDDRRSVLNLLHGYLHLTWTQSPARWPLYVYTGGERAPVPAGEYFFEQDAAAPAAGPRICVASGELRVSAIRGEHAATLKPGACYASIDSETAATEIRSTERWEAMRQGFAIDPKPSLALAAWATLPAPGAAAGPAAPGDVQAPSATLAAPAAEASASPAPQVEAPGATTAIAPVLSMAGSKDAPPPVPTADSEAQWVILVGSFSTTQNAERVQNQLIAVGYTPFLRVKNVDGRTWNSVQVRGFASREAAVARMDDIATRLHFRNMRVVYLQ